EVVVDVFALRAARDQRLQQAIDDVGELLGLRSSAVGAGKAVFHRTGLIDDEIKTGGSGAADLGSVRHLFLSAAPRLTGRTIGGCSRDAPILRLTRVACQPGSCRFHESCGRLRTRYV